MSQVGPWRLVREIGHGAYGTVHLAERGDGARAAVKVCRRDDIGEERYERELRGTKLYSAIPLQEGLARMREFVEEPWGFYAVMDLADDEFGGEDAASSGRAASLFAAASGVYRPKTLASVIDGEKALPLGESVKLGIALAKGLAALQRHHLLHRDIKPGNVIYVGDRPVLSDPGLVVEESEAASLVGTPGYVPPENFTAAAGDIYSLGLTLKAASFGRHIEDLDKGPALEADTGTKLFPAWWRILNKATDPTPSRRYQSAKALLKDLESLRRKIVLTPIIGSRVAKVVITVLALAALAIVVPIIITSRRAKLDVVRQSEENKALKDDLARQSAEIKSLKDELVRKSEEDKVQEADAARQSKEHEELKKFKANTEKMFKRSERDTLWPFYINTDLGVQDYEDHFKNRIDDVAKTNQVRAAEMRSVVAKIVELDREQKALAKEKIQPLYEIAKKKVERGLDDEEEYLRAQKIYSERCRIKKEIKSICKELWPELWDK